MINKRSLSDKIHLGLATLFGIGYLPLCPGSFSCLAAVFVFILFGGSETFFIITALSVVISFPVSERAEKIFQVKDSKKIVIDDFSGMLISFLFIPKKIEFIIVGFFLFRMLDMFKVPPADRIEKLNGAKGIVGDDLVAGAYACGILNLARLFL